MPSSAFLYRENDDVFYNDDEMEDLYVETAAQEKRKLGSCI